MKKIISLLLILAILPLSGCMGDNKDSSKLSITATLFPQYDFARIIGGDKVDVTLLLPAGVESHLYDPSPSDMTKIASSDLFIYTGDFMEGWAGSIASSLNKDVRILDVSRNIELFKDDGHEHEHSYDPHIWLDFDNAKKMCADIATELCLLSPDDTDYFTNNLLEYTKKLTELDNSYYELFEKKQTKSIIFGGRFALGYLTRRYNIDYKSAYSSCSAKSEPSAQDVASLCDYVKQNDVTAVYAEEFTDPKVAREIARANNCEVLVLHSCHNTNAEERENGETYISLMSKNLENLRKGAE